MTFTTTTTTNDAHLGLWAAPTTVALIFQEFDIRFPTEEDCVEELYNRLAEQAVTCRYCRGVKFERKYGDRTATCTRCFKRIWFTSGSFFHRIRSARPWLAAIWLMEHGVSISSSKFHKLVGIAYASAQAIFKKLTTVISSQMGEETIAVSSADFAPGICKRSRETPARKHPVSEQEVIDSQLIDHEFEPRSSDGMQTEALPFALAAFIARPDSDTDYQRTLTTTAQLVTAPEENTILGQLSVPQRNVYEVLSQEPTYFDNLRLCTGMPAGQLSATLTILELEGLVQRMAGDRYVRCLTAQPTDASMKPLGPGHFVSESTRKTVTAALNFIRINFDGISRKYLQNYLAAYWCHVERSRWAVGSLLEECLRFGPVTFAEILAYVSPASVKVLPVPQ